MPIPAKYYWIGGGLIAIATATYFGAKKLMKTVANITIRANGTHSFNFVGGITNARLVFKQDITFYNPENNSLDVQFKQIKVFRNQSQVAFTNPTQNNFRIPARGHININNTEIIVPGRYLLDMLNLFTDWLLANKEQKAKVTAQFIQELSFKVLVNINGHEVEKVIPANGSVTGLGVIAEFKRKIYKGSKFDKLFPKAQNKGLLITSDGDVEQTVKSMLEMVDTYKNETKTFAQFIRKKTFKSKYEIARFIWNFMYQTIQYKPDAEGVEQLRTPARVWHDRRSGVDCDCYSNFIASTLHNLNIPFKFRLTKYGGRSYFQHVYVVIPDKEKEIIIDVVLDQFNAEKPYSEKKDFNYPTT